MIATVFFYLFAAVLIASAATVVSARNPVHSVLFLILAFFNAAALFLIAGAEFLAMILVIVYVGAVAVLFLFVVMMLDVDFAELRSGFQRYMPVGAAVGAVLLGELLLVTWGWRFVPGSAALRLSPRPDQITNTAALGNLIYTDYVFLFQAAGLVLLVAMIGAIVLTLRERRTSRHQSIQVQTGRRVTETLDMVQVSLGSGITEDAYRSPRVTEPAGMMDTPEEADAAPAIHERSHGAGGTGHGAHHAPPTE
jgi:NADH-quinone oxidoreductase subunit J